MFSQQRNNYETYEDYENTPVGKAMLNMPWMWEPDDYPKKTRVEALSSPGTERQTDSAIELTTTFKPEQPATRQTAASSEYPGSDLFTPQTDKLPQTSHIDTLKNSRIQLQTLRQLKAKPDALSIHRQSTTKTQPETAQASTYPYTDIGQLMKPVSDNAIKKGIEPAAKAFVQAVKNKQPFVATPEADLVNTMGAAQTGVGQTYTKDNYNKAIHAIHQGETLGMESTYNRPPKHADVMAAIHAGDTLGMEEAMANPHADEAKGFENNLRDLRLSGKEIQQFGNKLFDPEGKYLNTKALQQWLNRERNDLESNQTPDLIDFTRLDWQKNPDKVIELGGKYFRQSLLGTHLFGLATEAMKGKAGPIANQIVGTLTGIARFYNQTDDMMAALIRGTASSSSENWDFVVGQLSQKLPLLSRHALQFMNHVLSREMKAKMFNSIVEQYKTTKPDPAVRTGTQRPSNTQKDKL